MKHETGRAASAPARLLRFPDVKHLTGLSRSAIYEMVKQGIFPAPVRVGTRAVAWSSGDIAAWIEDRISRETSPHPRQRSR
jgi:prophage regulatory protein